MGQCSCLGGGGESKKPKTSGSPTQRQPSNNAKVNNKQQKSNKEPREKSEGDNKPKSNKHLVSIFKSATCKPRSRIPARTYAQPLLYKNTKIIFLSGDLIRDKETGDLKSQSLSRYHIKDLKTDTIEERKINCDDNIQINILPSSEDACVYALNPENDKIYFIVNKKEIVTLDLNTNKLRSLNKEISDIAGTDNSAQIACMDGKIYILGPDKITNNENEEKDEDYLYKVPYKLAEAVSGKDTDEPGTVCKFYKYSQYGQLTRVITANIDKQNHILMMGGLKWQSVTNVIDGDVVQENGNNQQEQPEQKVSEEKDESEDEEVLECHDEIFITDGTYYTNFSQPSKTNNYEKVDKTKVIEYHTAYPIHSFGIINYKDQYLFQFGGIDRQKRGTGKRLDVRVLRLKEVKADKNEKEDKDKVDEYGLKRFKWYSLEMKIPKLCKGPCHALYIESMDCIELFNYFGKNFTFSSSELFGQLKKGEQKSIPDEENDDPNAPKILTPGWKKLNPWTEAGKTVNPTKSKSITNLGPAMDSEVDEMLRELGEVYEEYVNVMSEFPTFKDLINANNYDKLKGIIKNETHLQKVINTATAKSKQ